MLKRLHLVFYAALLWLAAPHSFFNTGAEAAPAIILPPARTVTLMWSYPEELLREDLFFKIYSTSNLSAPFSEWKVLAKVVGTNLSVTLPMNPGAQFFAVTAYDARSRSESSFATTTSP